MSIQVTIKVRKSNQGVRGQIDQIEENQMTVPLNFRDKIQEKVNDTLSQGFPNLGVNAL